MVVRCRLSSASRLRSLSPRIVWRARSAATHLFRQLLSAAGASGGRSSVEWAAHAR
jgi:hypothetical protein